MRVSERIERVERFSRTSHVLYEPDVPFVEIVVEALSSVYARERFRIPFPICFLMERFEFEHEVVSDSFGTEDLRRFETVRLRQKSDVRNLFHGYDGGSVRPYRPVLKGMGETVSYFSHHGSQVLKERRLDVFVVFRIGVHRVGSGIVQRHLRVFQW